MQQPETNEQQFLASNVEMNDEIIEPMGGGISPEIIKTSKTTSIEGEK